MERYYHAIIITLLFCFLTSLLIIPPPATATAPMIDTINTTCGKCAEKSATFSYAFCVTSLQAVPVSHAANLEGIAVVAVELALQNATATVAKIEDMMAAPPPSMDPYAAGCLRDCLELYADAIAMLVNAFWELCSRRFGAANVWLGAAMEAAVTCEEGFEEGEGEAAMVLTEENDDLFRLSEIALCITNLVSPESEEMLADRLIS